MKLSCQINKLLTCMFRIFPFLPDSYKNLHLKNQIVLTTRWRNVLSRSDVDNVWTSINYNIILKSSSSSFCMKGFSFKYFSNSILSQIYLEYFTSLDNCRFWKSNNTQDQLLARNLIFSNDDSWFASICTIWDNLRLH